MLWLGELLLIKRSFFTQTTQGDKDQKASKNEKEKVDKKHRLCIKQAKHYLYFTCRIFFQEHKKLQSLRIIIYQHHLLHIILETVRQSNIFRGYEYLENSFLYHISIMYGLLDNLLQMLYQNLKLIDITIDMIFHLPPNLPSMI